MKYFKTLFISAIIIAASSCSPTLPNIGGGTPGNNVVPEADLCLTSTTYSSPVTITGTAKFFKRGLSITKTSGVVTDAELSTPTSASLPIRFAEIRVLNSSGSTVQCGRTNTSGHLMALDGVSPLTISNDPGSYTIKIMSRTNHTLSVPTGKTPFKYVASVKKDIYSNDVHTLSGTVGSTGAGTISKNLVAYARESESSEILGGAFNIYNSLLVAYEYLSQNTGTSNLACLNPKLDVYWQAGFNPAQYLYPSADPNNLGTVSFYVRGENQLYINGGVIGNVSTKDTDHFDDSVIIHELGHHVEDVCGKMDSPGGTHYGLYRIDPRFAWSEGWGNFFGAHVIANNISKINPDLTAQLAGADWSHYLDTQGYADSGVNSGFSLIFLNLTRPGNDPEFAGDGRYYDKVDPVAHPGEGHTREVSVSRSLFKGANTCASGCANSLNFEHYWKAFENDPSGNGMGKSQYPFRSSVRFYNRLNAVAPSIMSGINPILDADEAQQLDSSSSYTDNGYQVWVPYGIKLVNTGSTPCTTPLRIQPRNEFPIVTDGFSDHRYSNHYFTIDLSILPGVTQITLTATKVGGGTDTDIDLILYKDGYRFNQDCTTNSSGDCISWAKNLSSADMVLKDRSTGSNLNTTFTKTISGLGSLSASNFYMLDVRAYTAHKTISDSTAYNYELKTQSGAHLCPSPTY